MTTPPIPVVEAELVEPTAILKPPDTADMVLATLIKPADQPVLAAVRALQSFDWKNMKPPELALLLMQKPFPVSGGTIYLTLRQALLFAAGCYELGVSPLSNQVWPDLNKGTVNLTYEGKKVVARDKGLDTGPPQFTRLERTWEQVNMRQQSASDAKAAGFLKDVGFACKMRVGKDVAEYTAWLSEWYMKSSPTWQNKPEHMLQVRCAEKTLTFALGTGISALPDEKEIE